MKPSNVNTRALAALTLDQVVRRGMPLDLALEKHAAGLGPSPDYSFVQELCYGVMRWYPRLSFIVNGLLEKPVKPKETPVTLLMMLGIYQLDFMRTPAHAAVSSTVDACHTLKKDWAKKLVNAVLRRYQREKNHCQGQVDRDPGAFSAHPNWLLERLKAEWPDYWPALVDSNNRRPPMHLRVNLTGQSRESYLALLLEKGIEASALPLCPAAVKLEHPVAVTELPGFTSGKVSVQDQGAQMAAGLLDLREDLRVLDACAAPGGKTAHIAETQPGLRTLLAIDHGARRVELLKNTCERLKLTAQTMDADACKPGKWWDGQQFDRILLDAPCSASGVIRRHPDIKLLRRADQLPGLVQTQSSLLEKLWPLLKPGGRMLYATCSIFEAENDIRIETQLRNSSDARVVPVDASWGTATRYGRQLLPAFDDTDGFYYAVLEKKDVG